MSEKSATPILVAGAVGTVVLLGIAWMFAASAGDQARLNAEMYAASKKVEVAAEPEAIEVAEAEVAEVAEAEVEEPAEAEAEVAEAEAEKPAEPEVAEVETEAPAEPEVAEASVEPEVAEAEVEQTAEPEIAEVEAEEPAETEVAEVEKPAEPEVAEAAVEEAAPEVAAPAAAAAPAAVDVASIDGDAKAGAKVFRKCKACHKIGEGAKNAVGPHLTNVVGRVQGSVEDYTKYSDGFKAAMAEGKEWTPAELDAFLTKPKDYMKGTKMAFGGLRKEKDRANVIAYLATNGE